MALKEIGLVIFIDLLRANQQLAKDYKSNKDELFDNITSGSILVGSSAAEAFVDERFPEIFNKYFVSGFEASKLLVDKEVVLISDTLQVPFRYNRDVIDLINENSIFTGYADRLYQERFTRQEVDRIKRTILSATYRDASEEVLQSQLTKNFNLTNRRAQLLARMETKRLRETTKSIYFKQPEVQRQYDLVWSAVGDAATRPEHMAMDGLKADSDGYFNSPDFGRVSGSPLAPNCRCSSQFIRK